MGPVAWLLGCTKSEARTLSLHCMILSQFENTWPYPHNIYPPKLQWQITDYLAADHPQRLLTHNMCTRLPNSMGAAKQKLGQIWLRSVKPNGCCKSWPKHLRGSSGCQVFSACQSTAGSSCPAGLLWWSTSNMLARCLRCPHSFNPCGRYDIRTMKREHFVPSCSTCNGHVAVAAT